METGQVYVASKFWVIIVSWLLAGGRMFVAAAAGAARMSDARFATGVASGNALLDVVERYTLPSLAMAAVAVIRG